MKFGLFVSGGLGFELLKRISKEYALPEFVATDKGSKEIVRFAEEAGIRCFAGNPRQGKLLEFLGNETFELALSINYLFILDQVSIERFEQAINFHGSLLPKYRGRTPHVWAIINNEEESGVTAHFIEEGCDTGDIILQKKVPISKDSTGNDILMEYNKVYPGMVFEILKMAEQKQLKGTPQDESQATYFGKRTPEDGLIDWSWDKERIRNWVRAQAHPYPGAFTYLGNTKIIIDQVVYSDQTVQQDMPNGTIVGVTQANQPIVKVADGCLQLIKIRNTETTFKPGTIFHA